MNNINIRNNNILNLNELLIVSKYFININDYFNIIKSM